MTALIIIGAIVLLIVFLGLIRIGIFAEYTDTGFVVDLIVFAFKYEIYPERKKLFSLKSLKKAIDKSSSDDKKSGSLKKLLKLLPVIKKFLSGLMKKIRIDNLTVYYLSANSDPFEAAMGFGAASAAAGMLTSFFNNVFDIRDYDVRTNVDFEITEPMVYVKLKTTLTVFRLLGLILNIVFTNSKLDKSIKMTDNKKDDNTFERKGK